MCSTCGNKINYKKIDQVYNKLMSTATPKSCTTIESEILLIKEKLKCIQSKIKMVDYNKYYGFILSMLKLREYCRYDLSILDKMFIEYGCDNIE